MVALMIAFSLIVVIFLMNLLIGLLNMAIVNDRTFYLVQKAEVGKNQSENISRPSVNNINDYFINIDS